jgi:hypothetical protein
MWKRWNAHLCGLRHGKHDNKHLQRSFNKYGERSFEFFPILVVKDVDRIGELEHHYIEVHRALEDGFNQMEVSLDGNPRHTEETKSKISAALRGRKRPPFDDLWLAHLSASGRSRPPMPMEVKKRISEATRGVKKPPLSEGARRKISEALSGRTVPEERKRRISLAHQGMHHTEQTKQKLSDFRRGKPGIPHTLRSRQKIRESHLINSGRTTERIQEIKDLSSKPEFMGRGGRSRLSRFLDVPRTTLYRILDDISRIEEEE